MRLTVLTENTAARPDITAEHGLSLYLEIGGRKVLFDMGQTDAFTENARMLGVDLENVDTAVLSHGHYDHGGGLSRFLAINHMAPVYVSPHAFLPHFNRRDSYIGLDPSLREEKRLVFVQRDTPIGDGLELLTAAEKIPLIPIDSAGLTREQAGARIPDDFRHEIYLLIREKGRRILISGCSHRGIGNIVRWFQPDLLVGGFHFKEVPQDEEGRQFLRRAGRSLAQFPTVYYTCHCTGSFAYGILKEEMGDRLGALSAGMTVEL